MAPATGSAAVNTNGTGEVQATAGNEFKFSVSILDENDEEVAESAIVTATVQKDADTITAITGVELYVTQNSKDVKVESGKLAKDDTAKVVVMGRTAATKADADDEEITTNAGLELTTDKVAVATVKADGSLDLANKAKGNVVITAKAGNLTKSITVNAGNDTRKVDAAASTITPSKVDLATGAEKVISVALVDQYGDTYVPADDTVQTEELKVDDKTLAAAVTKSAVQDDFTVEFTLKAGAEAGVGKVVVNCSGTELGEINLTVKKAGDVVEYKLETTDDKYVVDLKGDGTTIKLALNGYDEEGMLAQTVSTFGAEQDYSIASSDNEIATVASTGIVTGQKIGNVVIKVYETEDGFETTVASANVEVENSTPTITAVKVEKVDTVTEAKTDIDLNDIFTITALDPAGKAVEVADFTDTKIKEDVDGTPGVEIGSFLITAVDGITVSSPTGGTITIGDAEEDTVGKTAVNIAVLDADGNLVNDVDVDVDIPIYSDEAKTAITAVEAYEALGADLDNDTNIAAAVTDSEGKKTAATSAVEAVVDEAETELAEELTGRIADVVAAVKTAATIDSVEVEDVTVKNAHESETTAEAVVKNATGVVLDEALTGDYKVTYAWEVTDVAQGEEDTEVTETTGMLVLTNEETAKVTATVTNDEDDVDVGDNWTIKVVVTQGELASAETTATVTAVSGD